MSTKRLKRKQPKKSQGIALIIVILALAIMLLMGLVVTNTATNEVSTSGSSAIDVTSHYLAESGLNQALSMVRNIQNGDLNDLLAGPEVQCPAPCTGVWGTTTGTHPLASHGNELVLDLG